jgi:nitrogen fixation protein
MNKYLHSKTLSHVQTKDLDSPFWKGLMKVKDDFFSRGQFQVGNGWKLDFGKILGWLMNLCPLNIPRYTT